MALAVTLKWSALLQATINRKPGRIAVVGGYLDANYDSLN